MRQTILGRSLNLPTHIILTWISGQNPDSHWRSLFRSVLLPRYSNTEATDRVRTLVESKHFKGCPWAIGVQLLVPENIDWKEVIKVVHG